MPPMEDRHKKVEGKRWRAKWRKSRSVMRGAEGDAPFSRSCKRCAKDLDTQESQMTLGSGSHGRHAELDMKGKAEGQALHMIERNFWRRRN